MPHISYLSKRELFIWDKYFSTLIPILCWKMQFLPHISSPSSWIWKNSKTKGCHSSETSVWVPTVLVMLKNAVFPHISSTGLKNFKTKGVYLSETNILSNHIPMLCWKCSFWPISPLQVVRFEKFQGGQSFKTNVLSTYIPMLSWNVHFLAHISSQSSWIWKMSDKTYIFQNPQTPLSDPLPAPFWTPPKTPSLHPLPDLPSWTPLDRQMNKSYEL